MTKKITVIRTMTDEYNNDIYNNEFEDVQDALEYATSSLNSSMTKSILIERHTPKRHVARFTLYNYGKVSNGNGTENLTADKWPKGIYGVKTTERIQAEIDANPYSHSDGEMHSLIPDYPHDNYARSFAVLIDSIDFE